MTLGKKMESIPEIEIVRFPPDDFRQYRKRQFQTRGRKLNPHQIAYLQIAMGDQSNSARTDIDGPALIEGPSIRLPDRTAIVLQVNRFGLDATRMEPFFVSVTLQKVHVLPPRYLY